MDKYYNYQYFSEAFTNGFINDIDTTDPQLKKQFLNYLNNYFSTYDNNSFKDIEDKELMLNILSLSVPSLIKDLIDEYDIEKKITKRPIKVDSVTVTKNKVLFYINGESKIIDKPTLDILINAISNDQNEQNFLKLLASNFDIYTSMITFYSFASKC